MRYLGESQFLSYRRLSSIFSAVPSVFSHTEVVHDVGTIGVICHTCSGYELCLCFVKWEQGDCERGVEKQTWLDCPASAWEAGQFKDLKMDLLALCTPMCPWESFGVAPWAHTPGLKMAAMHDCHWEHRANLIHLSAPVCGTVPLKK